MRIENSELLEARNRWKNECQPNIFFFGQNLNFQEQFTVIGGFLATAPLVHDVSGLILNFLAVNGVVYTAKYLLDRARNRRHFQDYIQCEFRRSPRLDLENI